MKKVQLLVGMLVLATTLNLGSSLRTQANPIQKTAQPPQKATRNLAILIFDGVQIIDYTGPFETFGHVYSEAGPAFNIYTVSEKTSAITTSMGMSVNPKYSFETAPDPDVLLIPGGSGVLPLRGCPAVAAHALRSG